MQSSVIRLSKIKNNVFKMSSSKNKTFFFNFHSFYVAKLTESGAPEQHRQVIAAALFIDIILTSLIC